MATKIKPLVEKRFGHVPLRSIIASAEKGGFIATTKHDGQEYVGHGDTERQAQMNLNQKLESAITSYKLRSR